jgi:hypothetical protein
MLTATFYFLGVAGFLVAACACLTKGRRVSQRLEVDLTDIKAASVSLLMAGKKPTWDEMRGLWMQWYARCQAKATQKQQAIYSWARTLVLCAVICIVGIVLQVELDEQASLSQALSSFGRRPTAASHTQSPESKPPAAKPASETGSDTK